MIIKAMTTSIYGFILINLVQEVIAGTILSAKLLAPTDVTTFLALCLVIAGSIFMGLGVLFMLSRIFYMHFNIDRHKEDNPLGIFRLKLEGTRSIEYIEYSTTSRLISLMAHIVSIFNPADAKTTSDSNTAKTPTQPPPAEPAPHTPDSSSIASARSCADTEDHAKQSTGTIEKMESMNVE